MPASFTHYLFGQQVAPQLPYQIHDIILSHKDLYDIGLFGPDIIFYYRPLIPHSVSRIGYQMHKFPARYFFEQAQDIIRQTKDPALLSYTLGFICHFILDSNCHQYIYEKIKTSKVSHVEMECELDRMLMISQHLNPLRTNPIDPITVDMGISEKISKIFLPLTPEQVYDSLQSMKFYHQLLISPSPSKRHLVRRFLSMTHTEGLLGGFILKPLPNPDCEESNQELMKRYYTSLKEAPSLLIEFYESLYHNDPLSVRFDRTFQG